MYAHNSLNKTSGTRIVLTLIPVLVLRSVSVIGIILKYLLLIFIIALLVAFCLRFVDNQGSYYIVQHILYCDNKILAYIKQLVPTTIKGWDLSRFILIAAAYFVRIFAEALTFRTSEHAEKFKFKEKYRRWKVDKKQKDDRADTTPMRKDLKTIKKRKIKNGKERRGELLKLQEEVRRNLDSMKRDLTFLSIDVVDSTGMKVGEDPSKVELDFYEYRKLVEKSFKDSGYLKATWTPDGTMSCFKTPNAAVKAAKQLISDLKGFNQSVKRIKRDFIIRCGINTGKVLYDKDISTEEISDRTIDIAGHLQKFAPPGTIYISKAVYTSLFNRDDFKSVDKLVDGVEVFASNHKKY